MSTRAMDQWVGSIAGSWRHNMAEFLGDDIATKYSALITRFVASGDHR